VRRQEYTADYSQPTHTAIAIAAYNRTNAFVASRSALPPERGVAEGLRTLYESAFNAATKERETHEVDQQIPGYSRMVVV
jgi:hypothetical protein